MIDLTQDAKRKSAAGIGTGGMSGAATGAAIGSALGTAVPGLGNLVGAGIGAGVGALGGALAGGLGAKRTEAEKLRDDLLQKEINAAEAGQLGMNQSEKDRLIQDQTAAAGSRIQAQQADIARQQLAGGGGFSGNFAALQRDLAGQEAETAAQGSRFAEEASRAQEQQRFNQLTADLNQRAETEAQARLMRQAQQAQAINQILGVVGDMAGQAGTNALREGLGEVDLTNLTPAQQRALQIALTSAFREEFGAPASLALDNAPIPAPANLA